jgi:hypothetical protein
MDNKTEIMQHVFKMQQIFLLPKYIKPFSSGVFLHVCTYMNTGHLEVKFPFCFIALIA